MGMGISKQLMTKIKEAWYYDIVHNNNMSLL